MFWAQLNRIAFGRMGYLGPRHGRSYDETAEEIESRPPPFSPRVCLRPCVAPPIRYGTATLGPAPAFETARREAAAVCRDWLELANVS